MEPLKRASLVDASTADPAGANPAGTVSDDGTGSPACRARRLRRGNTSFCRKCPAARCNRAGCSRANWQPVNDSVLGLFLHVLDPFLAATLHFLGADVFLMGAQHPLVAKRIEHGAHAVAPELVLGVLYQLGPCLYGPVDRGVHVGHIDHESAGGSAPRLRAEGIPFLEFIREHETGIADLHFRVAD